MSIDFVLSVGWDVLKWVVVPIKRQFGYVMSSNSFADDLREKVGNLNKEAERVNDLERRARNNVRIFHNTFMEWKASAEKDTREAQELLDAFDEESKTCCHGTLPNPKCRYRFSRNAEGKIKVIKQLAQRCSRFNELNDISSTGPAPGDVAAPNPARREGIDAGQLTTVMVSTSFSSTSIKLKDDDIFASRESIIREIMDALADNKNSVVGIYGMGGVGKSTLMSDVERKLKKEKSFDWVAKADVSEYPDIRRIQEVIAHALGLSDIKNEDNVDVRAQLLHKRLEAEERQNKRVLIILDNLWGKLDLKTVGIPCGHDNKVMGCMLLLTSRDRDVLRRKMGCDEVFRLGELREEEAERLFKGMVGDKVHDDEFKPLVDEALRKCAGLPFLIVALANTFRDADIYEWKVVLGQIEMSRNCEINETINNTLQLSYDRLKGDDGEEAKSLLRLCVVYGVSKPSIENLVRYSVGSRLFREYSGMEEVRNRLRSLIRTLIASSLLLVDDEDADSFKIHDLVRGFVASVASRDNSLLVLKNNDELERELRKDKLKSRTAVCFPYVDMKELPEELDCPQMQIFLLFAKDRSLKVPDSYFNSMRRLMVLHLSQVCVTCSPSAFQSLEHLHTLCLDNCSIEDVAVIGQIKWLHVLSFRNSTIQRLPKEIGQLEELRSLDLNDCYQLKVIDPGVLGRLINLEELYMWYSFDRWSDMEGTGSTNARLIELNNMKNLCTLHVFIPDPSVLPQDLNLKNLTQYKIQIGDVERWPPGKGSSILEVELGQISNILQKGSTRTLLEKTDDVFLDGLNGIEQSICALSQEGFSKLKYLHVTNSPSIHCILQSSSHMSFRRLEWLHLENLINLETICNNHFSSKSFSALKVVQVNKCNKMEVLLPLSLLRQLPQLEEIHVIECHLMREIVEVDDYGKVELSNLHVLELRDLPNIKNFCTVGTAPSSSTSNNQFGTQVAFFNGQQVSIPSLKSLTMAGLPNLKEIWSDDCPHELSNLQFLKVSSCKSVSKVIDSRSLAKLHKLNTLKVKDCLMMQEIFGLDGLDTTPYELSAIQISQLPSLRHIWNKNPCSTWSFCLKLRTLKVEDCNNLEFLFFPCMVQSLSQLREITIKNCKKMEAIIMEEEELRIETSEPLMFSMLISLDIRDLSNLTCFFRRKCSQEAQIEDHIGSTSLFNQEVSIPSLESLTMIGLPNLKEIWSDDCPLELSNLQFLKVSSCKSVSKVIDSWSLAKLHKLHTLEVRGCDLVQEIFSLDGLDATTSKLTTIHISWLPSLRHIWNKDPCEIMRFHDIRKLEVDDCKNLEFLFFPSMVQSLSQLRELTIKSCEKMDAIIMEEEGLTVETSKPLVFSMLISLNIQYLDGLMCFFRKKCSQEAKSEDRIKSCSTNLFNQEVAFPNLEALQIVGMGSIEKIWDDQVVVESFPNLKSLHVRRCYKLVNIVEVIEKEGLVLRDVFPRLSSLELEYLKELKCFYARPHALRWPALKMLVVNGCNKVEIFVSHRENGMSLHKQPMFLTDKVAFPSLETLKIGDMGSLERIWDDEVALFSLRKLVLYELPRLKRMWDEKLHSQVKFQCLRSITIRGCWSLTSLFPASVAMNLIQLEELEIEECGIVELIEREGLVRRNVFPRLSSLKLEHLTELKCVYASPHALCWPALKTLEVNGCDKVEIFASHQENEMPLHKQPLFLIEKGAFRNLEKLTLNSLGPMEIWHGRFHDEEFFCKLRLLKLHNFSMEFAISTNRFVQSLTSLENMVVCNSYLEELSINMEAIEGQSHGRWFRHIKTLDVSYCDELSKLFTSTIAQNLVELTELRISNCKILAEVICEEGGKEEHVLVFNQLKCIELKALTALRCFNSIKYKLKFPLLENVIVSGCPRMKFFSSGLIEAPKLGRVQVSTDTWFWKENLDITIQNMFEEVVTIVGQKVLQLSEFPELIGKWHSELNPIKSSFELEILIMDKCPSFMNGIPSKLILVLEKMSILQVCNCELLEEIFDLEGLEVVEGIQVLPRLTDLNLVNLPRLKRLWNKDLQGMMHFNQLHNLILYNCSNLRHALVPSMAQCLPNLNRMEIKECGQMEGVIVEEEGQGSATKKITFSNLNSIELEGLPNLTCFLSGKNHTLDCPWLRYLNIAHCPKMRSLTRQTSMDSDHSIPSLFTLQVQFPSLSTMVLSHMDNLRKIWTDNPQDPPNYEYLWKVEVENCKQLENLFPNWMATNLKHLWKFRVESCGIEEVVTNGDDTAHSVVTQILFPQLTSLVFHDMPQLKSFCPAFPILNCPVLKELRVTHCDKLNMLSLATSINKWAPRDDQHDLSDHEAHSLFDRGILDIERLLVVDKDIRTIQNGKFSDDFFDKIKSLTLACFHDEKASFPPRFLLQRFLNLQNLEIYCCSFEDIVLDEVLVDEGKHQVLENLRELKLSKLHNLKQLWREDYSIAKILQSIVKFEVWDCPGLTTIFPIVTSFWNLTNLVVKNSSGLVHLIKISVLENLVHLNNITVIGCENMKEVLANDGEYEGKVISLRKLWRLTLEHLPSLECFSSIANCSFRFPSLNYVIVEECPQMKIFSKGIVSTPAIRNATLFQYSWRRNWVGDLNTAIQKSSA